MYRAHPPHGGVANPLISRQEGDGTPLAHEASADSP
jgi:hypothetical protein